VVDPTTTPEPVPPVPEPVSALEPEPDPGPLPDYVVDPAKPRERAPEEKPTPQPVPVLRLEPQASIGPEPEPDEPSLAGLGLPPLTEFPSVRKEPDAEDDGTAPTTKPATKGKRSRQAPVSSRRGRRDQSAEEPGDEAEAIDWMDGLSSRLSAYSLADDSTAPDAPADNDGKVDEEDTEP
jgi:hypothetical protein